MEQNKIDMFIMQHDEHFSAQGKMIVRQKLETISEKDSVKLDFIEFKCTEHRNTANLLRNYVYLLIACVIVGIIGGMISEGVGDFFNYVIAGGIDLYLFYQFSTCYHEMSNVKL